MSEQVVWRGSGCWEGAREWGGLANRWQGEGAGVVREMREVTRDCGGEGRGGGGVWGGFATAPFTKRPE